MGQPPPKPPTPSGAHRSPAPAGGASGPVGLGARPPQPTQGTPAATPSSHGAPKSQVGAKSNPGRMPSAHGAAPAPAPANPNATAIYDPAAEEAKIEDLAGRSIGN